jgi:hypothetical protein
MKDNDYFHLVKQLAEVKDLLSEVLRRLGKLEYSGTVQYGNKYHATSSEKQITVSLRRNKKESPNPHGDDDFATPT